MNTFKVGDYIYRDSCGIDIVQIFKIDERYHVIQINNHCTGKAGKEYRTTLTWTNNNYKLLTDELKAELLWAYSG